MAAATPSTYLATPRAIALDAGGRRERLVQQIGGWLAFGIAFLCPIVAVYISGDVLGASDPLMPGILAVILLGKRRGSWEACYWALVIFLAFAFFSLLQIENSRIQFRSALKWVRLIGICLPFYLGLRLEVSGSLLRRLAWGLFWGGLIAMAIALVIYIFQIPIRTEGQRLWYRGGSFYRAGGLIGETTAFGHMTATWITITFSLLCWVRPVRQWRLVAVVLAVAGIGMIFASSSRAALLNVMAFSVALWFSGRIQKVAAGNLLAASLAGVLLLVTSIALIVAGSEQGLIKGGEKVVRQVERFAPLGSADQFSSGRLEAWQKYSRIIRSHFWLGCGYKTATRLMPGHTPDNSVLSALLETGVFGLLAIVSFSLLTTLTLWTKGLAGNRYAEAMVAVWCGQLVQALTNDTHTLLLGVPVLYLFTGLVLQMDPMTHSDANEDASTVTDG